MHPAGRPGLDRGYAEWRSWGCRAGITRLGFGRPWRRCRCVTNGNHDTAATAGTGDAVVTPYRGRPVDVAMMKDGSMLISDDFAGALYRVTYGGM